MKLTREQTRTLAAAVGLDIPDADIDNVALRASALLASNRLPNASPTTATSHAMPALIKATTIRRGSNRSRSPRRAMSPG